MNTILHQDALQILNSAILSVKPDAAVQRAISDMTFSGRLILVAIGKAGWQMAKAAVDCLDYPIHKGIVVTKYGHVNAPIPGVTCYEAGHPVPDQNSFQATKAVLEITKDLTAEDTVLFLVSGGGSALFELPEISEEELSSITTFMLKSGMNINEMNCIRKRLSKVKGGKFARWCAPAKVESIILSDIVGDPLDMIASGPCAPDSTTCEDAADICAKYSVPLSSAAKQAMSVETPKELVNVSNRITGSVKQLCAAAAKEAESLGYSPIILGDDYTCDAEEFGRLMASVLMSNIAEQKLCVIGGGETVVQVKGNGLGGRNQHLALTAAQYLAGYSHMAAASIGSDGTDGPTDAAGGYVDGDTVSALRDKGLSITDILRENDSYHGLQAVGGLIITGPTGTNVNDVTIGLIQ